MTSGQLHLHIYKYINLPSCIIDLGGQDHVILIAALLKAKTYFLNEYSNSPFFYFFHLFIHSANVYWPYTMCPGTGDEAVNKTDRIPALIKLNPR